MPCIRNSVFAGECDSNAARSGKAQFALCNENVVEPRKNVSGIVGGLATQSPENYGDPHGRRKTYS
jgi:hypothetical protein